VEKGGPKDECFMDRQYEYVFVSPSDYYGFLSHHAAECINPMVEKRIEFALSLVMANKFEARISKFETISNDRKSKR